MRALIVEDEIYNFEGLKRMVLKSYPQAEVEGPVTNLADLERAMMEQERYDVIYCDIRLEDGVCFTVLEDVAGITTPIVFTTAYSEYALKAFDANGIAYLLKPIKPDALRKATDKALACGRGAQSGQDIAALVAALGFKSQPAHLHYLKANTFDGAYIVTVSEVSHFLSEGKKSYAVMPDGARHLVSHTLEQLMQLLDPVQFFRANRQHIVNRRAIVRIHNYGNRQLLIKLKGNPGAEVLVSKENLTALYNWIEQ